MSLDLSYGPGAPPESELRLLGPLAGKRVLVLGCGEPGTPVALATQDAKVVTVDPSPERLALARELTEDAEVKVELHGADFADLAFVRADTIDAAVSVLALAEVDDLDRVFRQVHRVLRSQGPLVLSLPHPAAGIPDGRSWFGGRCPTCSPRWCAPALPSTCCSRPMPSPGARLPLTLVVRGRKLGT